MGKLWVGDTAGGGWSGKEPFEDDVMPAMLSFDHDGAADSEPHDWLVEAPDTFRPMPGMLVAARSAHRQHGAATLASVAAVAALALLSTFYVVVDDAVEHAQSRVGGATVSSTSSIAAREGDAEQAAVYYSRYR